MMLRGFLAAKGENFQTKTMDTFGSDRQGGGVKEEKRAGHAPPHGAALWTGRLKHYMAGGGLDVS